jgi:hypothetical protein
MLDNDDIYFKKYLKYKLKYLELKQSGGGVVNAIKKIFNNNIQNSLDTIKQTKEKYIDIPKPNYYKALHKAFPIIFNLITDLKKDLLKEKSTFNIQLLDNFEQGKNFKKDSNPLEKDSNPLEKNDSFINKITHLNTLANSTNKTNKTKYLEEIEKVNLFIDEINLYTTEKLNGMKYLGQLQDIIGEYLYIILKCLNSKMNTR